MKIINENCSKGFTFKKEKCKWNKRNKVRFNESLNGYEIESQVLDLTNCISSTINEVQYVPISSTKEYIENLSNCLSDYGCVKFFVPYDCIDERNKLISVNEDIIIILNGYVECIINDNQVIL